MVRIIKVKVLIKVPLKVKINFPPIGHLSTLVPLKALRKILQGSPPKVLPKVLIKASLMVKVLLHLPFSHLPPTPHLVAVHKISLIPTTSPAASLGILSGSQSGPSSFLHPWFGPPSHACTSLLHSSLSSPWHPFFHDVLSSPRIPLLPVTLSRLPSTPTPPLSNFSLPLLVASLGILSGSPLLLLFAAVFLVLLSLLPLSSPSTFSLSSRLSPPLLLSSAPIVSQGVCPKWLGPTRQHLL